MATQLNTPHRAKNWKTALAVLAMDGGPMTQAEIREHQLMGMHESHTAIRACIRYGWIAGVPGLGHSKQFVYRLTEAGKQAVREYRARYEWYDKMKQEEAKHGYA